MPRSFDMAADYEASVEQVHRAFRDEQYWSARLTDSGADEYSLDSMVVDDDGGIDVVTTQTLRADRLPGLVTQFHWGDLSFVREETWSPVRDGRATATIKGAIDGAPAGLSGTAVLAPSATGRGSRLEFNVSVEVRVPLVGGKIENFIGSKLVDLLIAEQRFTTGWITENA
ncbi:DUF2505 domain-containing protein [Mycolicibacterium holsaticum]|jgi:hypothetical protein|uniref:DUF2505 domain-containing protein n=1 Tax=Mycolicibacterium holsaticum TaxID=152142 RepID=UPI001C7E0515|nr:DUF2505 domain-containing protein [Mycolicibacterium holsaticum]QZA12021.1 DUF2505 domain-containing protein [Mycolicibacterium holsaticum DSM 44478 = JCM 12374]UNC10494.1 DUF2505 domain-containing protein [Mycolicibacterium holsaticum DSM 44478 = JCM 12374]